MNLNTYAPGAFGDISPRTAAFVVKELLKRATPLMVFEKYGQAKPIPANSTQNMVFRRYFMKTAFGNGYNPAEYLNSGNFDPTSHMLAEGVTPEGSFLGQEDISVSLTQYGDLITITDVIQDTHEDPILKEATGILAEQAALILEKVRFQKLVAGTNVFRAGAANTLVANRNEIAGTMTLELQRRIVRGLKRNLAQKITSVVKSTPSYDTAAIAPSYIAVCHTDMENVIRDMPGFVPTEKYGTSAPLEGEIGKVEDVRYVASTIVSAWADAGADAGSMMSNGGVKGDVYPILFLGRDAYAITPLKGGNSIVPMVVNMKPSSSDPLAQRGHVSWKAYHGVAILNQAWMTRAEVCVPN